MLTLMLNRLGTAHLLAGSALLLSIGLVMVYSASALRAELLYGSSAVYLGRQLTGMALGVAAALLISRLPLEWIAREFAGMLPRCQARTSTFLSPISCLLCAAFRRPWF